MRDYSFAIVVWTSEDGVAFKRSKLLFRQHGHKWEDVKHTFE